MKPAFAYLRVSSPGQTAPEKDGIPRQIRAIEHYAARHELKIVDTFKEDGVCGATELDGRPALRALVMATMPVDAPKVVVIERLDRLARDLMVQETIMGDFRRRNVEIISTAEPDIYSTDPTRVFIRQIFGALAQYDKAMLVAKLKVAREARQKITGRLPGPNPYGTRKGDQVEKEAIEIMKDLRMQHNATFREIAEELERQKVPLRRGRGRWNPGTVMRVLRRAGVR
jgi:DNA invertase Pin-like site-specific DNA recombinase